MHIVTFIVAAVFLAVAILLFGLGLVKLYRDKEPARGLISGGLMTAVWGIVIAAVLTGFFSI